MSAKELYEFLKEASSFLGAGGFGGLSKCNVVFKEGAIEVHYGNAFVGYKDENIPEPHKGDVE